MAIAAATLFAAAPRAEATTWNFPAPDLSAPGRDAFDPHVAVAANGATTAVWTGSNGSKAVIQTSTRPAGSSTFGAVEDLSSPTEDAGYPLVAVAPDGTTTVIWTRYNGATNSVQARTRAAGSATFGPIEDLSAAGGNAVSFGLAVAADGTTTAVWPRNNGTNNIVQARTRPAGSDTFGPAQDLSATGQSTSSPPRLAVAPDGATAVVWTLGNGSNNITQVRTRPAGSDTFSAVQDLSAPGLSADFPQVAVAPGGATTVVWRSGTGGTSTTIQASTRPAGSGTFGAAENLSAASGQYTDLPQVAVAPDGATTAIWTRSDGTGAGDIIIQGRTRPASSGAFGPVEDLSAAGQASFFPQVEVAVDGATTVVWKALASGNYVVQARTRPGSSDSYGAVNDLSVPWPGGASPTEQDPQLAVGSDGAVDVAWTRFNGTNYIVQDISSTATTYALTTAAAGDGRGTISSSPAGINCGSACSASFALSSRVTLTATPAAGSTFGGWSGDCSGSATACTVDMLGARRATAAFTKNPAPANAFTVLSTRARGSSIATRIRVPGAGRITQRGTYRVGRRVRTACTASRTVTRAGTYTVTCRLNSAARKQRKKGRLRVAVRTTFTPTGGTSRSAVRTVVFRSLKPRFAG